MFKIILFITVLLATTIKTQSTETELLKFKSNWSGNGNAILYPGAMKLLNQKMNQQAGVMSTITQMPGGDTWDFEISFKISCEGEPTDLGVGFWLTLNDPKMSPLDYNFETVNGTYGMIPSIDGLGLLYANKSLYTGLMRSERVTKGDLFYRSKSCKIYVSEGKHLKFKVKYRNKVLGVYALEHKEKVETLCLQYTEVENFNNFYVSASASTEQGKCSIDINKMSISQPEPLFQVIDEKDKKIGDPFFAYFSDMEKTKHYHNWEEYNSLFQLYRENSKILAQELLEFADINQKELSEKFTKDLNEQIQKVTKAIEVIGIEAQQLENLSNFIEQDKKTTSSNLDDLFEQIMKWFVQMELSYTKVDEETQRIYNLLNEVNVNEKIGALIKKSESVVNALNSLLFKARDFASDKTINSLDSENIEYWDDQLKMVKEQLNEGIKKSTSDSSSTFKTIAYGFLISLAIVIFLAFGYMYWKIQKAIKHKRIL